MLKYNDDNIYGGYIKQLLASFNLPQCPIGNKGFAQSIHYIEGNSLYFYNNVDGTTTRVSSYKENEKIENITKNLEIRNNLYDSYTHEYLGDYLRYVRDYKGLDLMSMYNCFSNVAMSNTSFIVKGSSFDTTQDEYTIFVIPVRYDKKYTIAIDWHGPIEMCCGYYSGGKRYSSYLNQGDNVVENATYLKKNDARFNHPFVYDKLVNNNVFNNDYAEEKNFKLFLKIPTICKSSIVILEGDYTRGANLLLDKEKIIINRDGDIYLNGILDYVNIPQLLSMNYQKSFLIADRLMEYLSNQVITPIDPVIDNIRRLQTKLNKEEDIGRSWYEYYGIWDDPKIRDYLYVRSIDNDDINKYYDMLGYLDKDVERTFDIEYIIDKDGNKEENDVWQIR